MRPPDMMALSQGADAWQSKGVHTREAMDSNAVLKANPLAAHLLPELRLRIISFLPPNDLALGGRLSCKEAAQQFSAPHQCTAALGQPLPGHVVDTAWCLEGAQAAMKQLTFRQKLLMLKTAAASGCEANVEFALRLLQAHVFPDVLRTDHYTHYVLDLYSSWPDPASVAVSSGLAHLLPSLAQRCPGLLDPGPTLEAAVQHCDLAGLQAAWGAMGQLLQSGIQKEREDAQRAWCRILCAAAGCPPPDAIVKMRWVLKEARTSNGLALLHADVCGAAAASGDLALLAWVHDLGFPWGTAETLEAVVRHADLGFVQRLEQERGYLPRAEDAGAWASEGVVAAAAASARDSGDKLRWLAGRGAALGSRRALHAAAECGNLEAVQLLAGQPGLGPAGSGGVPALPSTILIRAVTSGSVPLAAWLTQAGYPWGEGCFEAAFCRGDLPMVRWLLEAGCPQGPHAHLHEAVELWPCHKPLDNKQLVEALRLLVAAGWPAALRCFMTAAEWQPVLVWDALRELFPGDVQDLYRASLLASSGCEATLEALMGVDQMHSEMVHPCVYYNAAMKGDRATLECLLRLGVPLRESVLAQSIRQGAPVPALRWLLQHGAPRGGEEEAALQGLGPGRREEVEALLQELPGP